MKRVKILWTGGYDSTFRISQLSRLEVEIEPFYLYGEARLSNQFELNAIREITEIFESSNQTKARFLPLKILNFKDFENDESMSRAFENIKKTDFLGYQYKYLGSFSRQFSEVELSVHKDDMAIAAIDRYECLKKVHDEVIGDYYVIDESKSPQDINELFGNFHFPLVGYTKKQMRKEYESQGHEDVMKKTWFCHAPIDGKPCGQCNPCKYTIEEGLYDRFDKRALLRYVSRKLKITVTYEYIRKFIHLLNNDVGRFLRIVKMDVRTFFRHRKFDFRKYGPFLKNNFRTYGRLFGQFRDDWKK